MIFRYDLDKPDRFLLWFFSCVVAKLHLQLLPEIRQSGRKSFHADTAKKKLA